MPFFTSNNGTCIYFFHQRFGLIDIRPVYIVACIYTCVVVFILIYSLSFFHLVIGGIEFAREIFTWMKDTISLRTVLNLLYCKLLAMVFDDFCKHYNF